MYLLSFKKIFCICLAIILITVCFSSFSYAAISYIWSDTSLIETVSEENSTDLGLESGGAILIEQATGTILYDHHSHEQFRPASVTKVMSLLLIMEAIDNRRNSII